MMYKLIILFCMVGVQPQDCTLDNSIAVIKDPIVLRKVECTHRGQILIAPTSLSNRLKDGEYLKTICVPTEKDSLNKQDHKGRYYYR